MVDEDNGDVVVRKAGKKATERISLLYLFYYGVGLCAKGVCGPRSSNL